MRALLERQRADAGSAQSQDAHGSSPRAHEG
jgi:hypothetical protein